MRLILSLESQLMPDDGHWTYYRVIGKVAGISLIAPFRKRPELSTPRGN